MATPTVNSSHAHQGDCTVINVQSKESAHSSSPSEIQNDGTTVSADSSDPFQNENNHELYLKLQETAVEGNVEEAKKLLGNNPGYLLGIPITEKGDTVFHVAAGANQALFVEEMIKLMEEPSDLQSILSKGNKEGNTAFCFAAMAGSRSIAETMLKQDPDLLTIRGGKNMTPLYLAALFGQEDMALYLYNKIKGSTAEKLDTKDNQLIFCVSINNTLYDLALQMLDDEKEENELAGVCYQRDNENEHSSNLTPLRVLAQTPLHLLDQTSESGKMTLSNKAVDLVKLLWNKILAKEGKEGIWAYFCTHKVLLFEAAHLGNFIFLEKLIKLYPDLVLQTNEKTQTIFHIALIHRHIRLFDLIKKTGFKKQLIATYLDDDNNSLLHLAAKYDPKERPVHEVHGAALEMQQELIIFKDVESLVMPSQRVLKNSDGETPRELFSKDHAKLFKKGEEWMQRTANSCMIVATIIATVVFSAASSVPSMASSAQGAKNYTETDEEGITKNTAFHIFSIADAISLCSSSISILIFLSILTSRCTENDFLRSLPLKLVAGVLTLFIAIATMMISFISTFFVVYKKEIDGIPGTIIAIGIVPVILFGVLEFHLLKDILYSSFRFRFFIKARKS